MYQPVTRDFAFIVDADVPAGDLLKAVIEVSPLLSDMKIADLYEGANIGEGKKSVAVTVTLTPTKATLTEEEIEKVSEIVKIAGKTAVQPCRDDLLKSLENHLRGQNQGRNHRHLQPPAFQGVPWRLLSHPALCLISRPISRPISRNMANMIVTELALPGNR